MAAGQKPRGKGRAKAQPAKDGPAKDGPAKDGPAGPRKPADDNWFDGPGAAQSGTRSERERSRPSGMSDVASIVLTLGQAFSSCLAGNLRYSAKLLELMSENQTRVAETLSAKDFPNGLDRQALAIIVDDLRAGLREAAELSLEEAEHLKREMLRVDQLLRSTLIKQPDDAARQHRRRWKGKV